MPITLLDPDGLMKTPAYRQVAIATGSKQVHVAGQVAYDVNGEIVARGSFAGQVSQAIRNVAIGLQAAGATFSDVVRMTIYVVDWKPEKLAELTAGMEAVGEEVQFAPAPTSLIEVVSLFEPGVLIEIEATAVLD